MFLLYFMLWVIFNGKITLEICLIGLVVAGVMFAFTCRFVDHSIAKERLMYLKAWEFVRYAAVLVKEIVKANYAVMRLILSRNTELSPALVSFRTDLETPTCRTFLANAITLTPGTITVSLEEDEYMVHCLDQSFAKGIDRSVFVERIAGLERGVLEPGKRDAVPSGGEKESREEEKYE